MKIRYQICILIALAISIYFNMQNYTVPSENSEEIQTELSYGFVYIAPYGRKYHYDPECAGQKAMRIELSEVEGIYPPCKKCT